MSDMDPDLKGSLNMNQDLIMYLLAAFVAGGVVTLAARRTIDAWQAVLCFLIVGLALAGSVYALPSYYMSVIRIVGAVLLLAMTLKDPRQTDLNGYSRWLFRSLWSCVAVGTVSISWSHSPTETLGQVLMLALLVAIFQEATKRRWLSLKVIISDLKAFYWIAFPLLGSGFLLYALGIDSATGHQGRLTGMFTNANMLGYLSVTFAMAGTALWFYSRRSAYIASSLILVVSSLMSESRTALVALTAGLVWIFLGLSSIKKVYTVWVISLVVAVWYAAVLAGPLSPLELDAGVLGRFSNDSQGDSLNGRSAIWAFALRVGFESRVGVGFGAAPEYLTAVGANALELSTGSAHNSMVQWFMETGIVGLVPIVVLLATCVAVIYRSASVSFARPLGGIAVAAAVTQTTESMIFGTGQIYPWIFWMAIAWLCVLCGQIGSPIPTAQPTSTSVRKAIPDFSSPS